jgi:threonine/homoserine/homoserine lactone efflux protein
VNEVRPLLAQTITLSAVYVAVATAVHSAIVLLADTARPWLAKQERSVIIRRVFSLLLVGIAIWVLFATRYKPSP